MLSRPSSVTLVLVATLVTGVPVSDARAQSSSGGADRPGERAAPGDTLTVESADEIVVTRSRARRADAVPYSDLTRPDLEKLHYGQDVPMLLDTTPSVHAWSDAGNGFGYSYLKIRGFEQDRVGMVLNGVPLNDPESHAVYWVDHGDILAGAGSVQVQRGVGTTLFGLSSFGGSVNVITSPLAMTPGIHLETGYGAFTDGDVDQPTRTYRAAFATGLVADGKAALSARYSRQDSEGYRRASGSDIETTGLSALYASGKMRHKIDLHAGNELTHFAWDGIPLADLDDRDVRRNNVYDAYSNNVDDFTQVVGSVSSEVDLGDSGITLSNTLYVVDGEGFFEQFETGEDLADYGVAPVDTTVTETDLVRRRWLVNAYWGLLPQARIPLGSGTATVGVGLRRYASDHFGELVWTEAAVDAGPLQRYYLNQTEKTSFEAFGRVELPVAARTTVSAALQYQGHRYRFEQAPIGNFRGYEYEANHDFVSPRLGVRQGLNDEVSVFASAAFAQREPSANDYLDEDDPGAVPAFEGAPDKVKGLDDPIVDPESVVDLELGAEVRRDRWQASLTLYQLEYRDQLIPLDGGRIEEEGRLRRANADRTRHQGVELEARARLTGDLSARGNVSFARHRFVDHEIFAYWLDDYAGGLLRYDDNVIPRSPEVLGNLSVDFERAAYGAGVDLRYVGKQYVDGENTEDLAIDPHARVDLRGTLDVAKLLGSTRTLGLEVRVLNVFDTLYETFGYSYYDDFPARPFAFYWPGATRSVFVTFQTVL